MTQEEELEQILSLLSQVTRAPEEGQISGATTEEIDALAGILGFTLPPQFEAWLGVCRGTTAGPGGIYGVGNVRESLNIAHYLDIFPGWADPGWIPVAGDGTGNYYVLATTPAPPHAVYFLDASSPATLEYIVASSLLRFLRFLLQAELGASGWPFDPTVVLSQDPRIAELVPPELLPWHA